MITVPGFLLKRLYVKGSLCNTPEGFKFELKNSLGSGWGSEIFPLVVDGQELPKEKSCFAVNGEELHFSEVCKEKPFTLAVNKTVTILVRGTTLSGGPHKVNFRFVAQGLGKLGFEVADVVSNA